MDFEARQPVGLFCFPTKIIVDPRAVVKSNNYKSCKRLHLIQLFIITGLVQ